MIRAVFFTLISLAIVGLGLYSIGKYEVTFSKTDYKPKSASYNKSSNRQLVMSTPIQKNLHEKGKIDKGDYAITPFAEFAISARVLGTERYRFDSESNLSPVDFALGWGDMSKSSVLKHIKISQSGRWYHWRYEQAPIPRRDIEKQSANMHMIPANEAIKDQLLDVGKDDYVHIEGYLVRIKNQKTGWYWNSSNTRNDTGSGSCEIIYVTSIKKI